MTDSIENEMVIINSLIQNENLLSKLYAINATLFPGDSKFWITISKDETVHASWLSELSSMVQQGSVTMELGRFNLESINKFGSYITDQTNRIRAESASAIKALSISMDIENSLLESGIFKVYDTDDNEMKRILNRLQKSTEIHHEEINERWLTERTRAGIT